LQRCERLCFWACLTKGPTRSSLQVRKECCPHLPALVEGIAGVRRTALIFARWRSGCLLDRCRSGRGAVYFWQSGVFRTTNLKSRSNSTLWFAASTKNSGMLDGKYVRPNCSSPRGFSHPWQGRHGVYGTLVFAHSWRQRHRSTGRDRRWGTRPGCHGSFPKKNQSPGRRSVRYLGHAPGSGFEQGARSKGFQRTPEAAGSVPRIDLVHMFMESGCRIGGRRGVCLQRRPHSAPDTINVLQYPAEWTATLEATLAPGIQGAGVELCGAGGRLYIDRSKYQFTPVDQKAQPVVVQSPHDQTIDHVENFLDCMRTRKRRVHRTPQRAGIAVGELGVRTEAANRFRPGPGGDSESGRCRRLVRKEARAARS